jgi:hypothetical protein
MWGKEHERDGLSPQSGEPAEDRWAIVPSLIKLRVWHILGVVPDEFVALLESLIFHYLTYHLCCFPAGIFILI